MASTIVTKNSSTASAVPLTGDLTQGELAVNVTDKKLYTKDSGGTVVKIVGGLGNQEANAVAITGGSINGTTVGATTASTGAFTTLSASSTVSGTGFSTYLASPPAIGGTAAAAGSFTTLSASGNTTLSGGTANGVAYLNGSKVVTTGSALTFDGSNFAASNQIIAGIGVATANVIARSNVANGGAGYSQFLFGNASGDTRGYLSYSHASEALLFGVASSEQMRLTSTGLGIGTSSPAYKLDVSRGSNGVVAKFTGTASAYVYAGTQDVYFTSDTSANTAFGANSTSNFLNFYTNGAERMRLDSSGNLGLGVTPSAWSTLKGFQFAGGAVSGYAGGGSNNQVHLLNNAYYGSGGWTYITSDTAQRYTIVNGQHQWFNAPSGTAGNPITFTQAMTLDASGNLLVGTTSGGGAGGVTIYPLGGGAGSCATQVFNKSNTTSDSAIQFRVGGSTVSGISYTSTMVTYGTVSDYRAKNVVGSVVGSGERIDALEPVEYEWKIDGSRTRGFLAHKFQEVYPNSVTGTKDAVDAEGKPVYQGMQAGSSEVIADLVAELQSLRKRVAQLEGK